MAILGEQSGLSGREVARRTAMDKVAVSRAVKKLQAANLVHRAVDGDDKRRSVLSLTEHGQNIYDQIVPITTDYEHALLEKLEDKEVEQLMELLAKLRDANKSL
jgi:DNA-binding MarR family transcriptional regulator